MHQPRPRVVRRERDRKPPAAGQEGDVAARRVLPREACGRGLGVELPVAAAEDVEVVAVEVDWVRDRDGGAGWLLDDPVGPLRVLLGVVQGRGKGGGRRWDTYDVGGGQLDEVVGRGVVCVLVRDVLERGLVPVDVDGGEVDAPHDDVLAVCGHGAGEVYGEVFDLVHKGGFVDCVLDPWDEVGVGGLVAVCGEGAGGGDGQGVRVWGVFVREDGESVGFVL